MKASCPQSWTCSLQASPFLAAPGYPFRMAVVMSSNKSEIWIENFRSVSSVPVKMRQEDLPSNSSLWCRGYHSEIRYYSFQCTAMTEETKLLSWPSVKQAPATSTAPTEPKIFQLHLRDEGNIAAPWGRSATIKRSRKTSITDNERITFRHMSATEKRNTTTVSGSVYDIYSVPQPEDLIMYYD